MWARIEERDIPEKNDVVELINFDPAGLYHKDLVFHKVPEWLQPYINNTFWWDENTGTFQDVTGYQSIIDAAKKKQYVLFDAAFTEIDYRRARPAAAVAEAMGLGMEPAPADINILGQLNMVAEENRILRKKLDAVVLPTPANEISMKAALEYIATIIPWIPWKH